MATENLSLSNTSLASASLGTANTSATKPNASFKASLNTAATDTNPAGVKTKLTDDVAVLG